VKAAGYLRVSTEGQAGEDKFGLPAQKEAIQGYVESQGIEIVAWYEDDGISGATIDRPGLQQMITDSGENIFDAVLVAKMDRIARDLFYSLFIEKELLLNEVQIISISEPVIGHDPMNTAFRQMMGVFAELEKSMIAARMTGGRKQKARGGGYAGGGAAIGYRAKRGGKVLLLDQEKALTVQRVFELRDKQPTWTLQQLADQLNKEGHTTAQGKKFKSMQVKRILDRKNFYSGTYSYSGIESAGQHEAILREG
jgi:site-specific DNA recombinase